MRAQARDAALAWTVSIIAFLVAGSFAYFPLMDTDIWWHLAAGRLIVNEGRFLFADPFAADTLGKAWTDVHWLFQVLVYIVHRAGGVAALVVAKVVLVGLGVGLGVRSLCARTERAGWLPAAFVVVGFLFPARHLLLDRPTILTLVLLTATVQVVSFVRRTNRLRVGLWLFPLQILWANVQGLYLLGPAVVACFVLGDVLVAALRSRLPDGSVESPPMRRTMVALACSAPLLVAAAALTPYGWHGLALPFKLLGRIDSVSGQVFSREVSENLAPWLLERSSPGPLAGFKWLAALTFLSFLPVLWRSLRLGDLCVTVLFFGLALTANRNVLLFVWVAGPVTARNLIAAATFLPPTSESIRRWLRRSAAAIACLGLVALVFVRTQEAHGEPSIGELAPFRIPEQAVNRMLASNVPLGSVFCSDRYGGYVAWRLFPHARPTMDGRLVLRTAEQYAEHLALGEHPEAFEAYRQRYGIEAVLLPTAYPDRFLPLVVWLTRQPTWRLLYTDGTETLFVHDEGGRFAQKTMDLLEASSVRAIEQELQLRYGAYPLVLAQAKLHLARLLAEVGAASSAEAALASVPGIAAETLRARIAYLAGDTARAEALSKQLLARQPDEIESLCLLAVLARERGDFGQALHFVERALAVDAFHPLARRLLEQLKRDAHPAH